MPEGLIFGLVDNGILAFTTLIGIDIDKYLKGQVFMEPFMVLSLGNSLSDFLGAILDPNFPLMTAINITIGCLAVVPLVWLILLLRKG